MFALARQMVVNLLTEIGMIQGSRELEKAEDIKSSVEDTIYIRFQLDIQVDMSIWQLNIQVLTFKRIIHNQWNYEFQNHPCRIFLKLWKELRSPRERVDEEAKETLKMPKIRD